MTAPVFDLTKPDPANPWGADLVAMRDSFAALLDAAASASYAMPGWATVANDPPEYSSIVMTQGSVRMRWLFTWADGLITHETRQYDRGLGVGYETLSTLTYSYDVNNNWLGATTS